MTWKSSCSQKVIFVKIKLKYPAFPHFITDLEKYVFKKLSESYEEQGVRFRKWLALLNCQLVFSVTVNGGTFTFTLFDHAVHHFSEKLSSLFYPPNPPVASTLP